MSLVKAFLVGGVLCGAAQVLIDKTKLTPAKILTGYVVAGVIFGAAGIYEPLADFAGAGATVPLLGFGNALAAGVREAVDAKGIIGVLTGGITACAAGISAAVAFSFFAGLFVKSGEK
ncbi:MAG: SpoVA/SpoVAEb family sporulation membrane protein [Oscillospiraceae bacterium]|nr:SpoVA/SpoVAEb family sporulation membrane protein [Oscillospiraceae bacterium]